MYENFILSHATRRDATWRSDAQKSRDPSRSTRANSSDLFPDLSFGI